MVEVAHDLYNARRYPLPCLRAQNLTTNHRNGHRLAGCQVPRLVPSWSEIGCWEHRQPGRHLRPIDALDNFALSTSFSTVFMYPFIQRKIQRNHASNGRIKQRILNSNFGDSRALEYYSRINYRTNLGFDIIDFFASGPCWLGRYMYGLNRPRHAQ